MKRMTIEQIREKANEVGCKLITDVYKNQRQKMDFICSCGNKFKRDWEHFKRGQNKCEICSGQIRWDINKINDYVNKNTNCKVLSNEYVPDKNMLFLCSCGNEFEASWRNFYSHNKRQCNNCGNKIKSNNRKIGIDTLKQRTKDMSSCELLSNDYNDMQYDNLIFKCSCGEIFKTTWTNFCSGKQKCSTCSPNSVMEYKTEEVLKNNNINYETQYSFEDLKSSKGWKIRFDFKINLNKENFVLLELDGELHYEEACFKNNNNTAKLKHQQACDKLKDEYCKINNIPLYRIDYTKRKTIEKEITNLLKELNLL